MTRPQHSLPLVRDWMSARPLVVRADMPILDALDSLAKHHFSGAPVVDAQGGVVGVLSEVDVLRLLVTGTFEGGPLGGVESAMTREVQAVHVEDDVFAAAHQLLSSKVRRLPVLDGRELVGVFTVRDADRALRAVHGIGDRPAKPATPGAAWDPRASEERDRRTGDR